MFKISYHDSQESKTMSFKDADDFLTEQMREVPALQDDLVVDRLEIDGKAVDFTGTTLDLFNKYNQLKD